MKKILMVIGLSVLILVGFPASTNAMSDAAKQTYLDWVKTRLNDGASEVFLAVAPNGCTFAYSARIKARAKFQALRRCKKRCGKTCVIKDHNGKSAFIKQRGSSVSSSTSTSGSSSSTSSSNKIWCATKRSVSRISRYSCDLYDGESFDTQSQAKAEHNRLKSASTATSGSKYDPAIEEQYWNLVKDSGDPDLLQAYLDEYPNGKFAPLARLKIKKLKAD